MKFALSTNWCNQRIESGAEIVRKAAELGFDALELGFNTTAAQAKEIRASLNVLPVGSVHAFCPVPISAPQGHPELYQLASSDAEAAALAAAHVKRNIEFAASVGADALVLHAGRVMCRGWFRSRDMKRRVKRGARLLPAFRRVLDSIVPVLEKNGVRLGLENLPYLEGFPAEWEMAELAGEWVRPWLDIGHDYVRRQKGWVEAFAQSPQFPILGLHINDSNGGDDHLPPGEGKVDFAAFAALAVRTPHLVLEPHPDTTDDALTNGLSHLKSIWGNHE